MNPIPPGHPRPNHPSRGLPSMDQPRTPTTPSAQEILLNTPTTPLAYSLSCSPTRIVLSRLSPKALQSIENLSELSDDLALERLFHSEGRITLEKNEREQRDKIIDREILSINAIFPFEDLCRHLISKRETQIT